MHNKIKINSLIIKLMFKDLNHKQVDLARFLLIIKIKAKINKINNNTIKVRLCLLDITVTSNNYNNNSMIKIQFH